MRLTEAKQKEDRAGKQWMKHTRKLRKVYVGKMSNNVDKVLPLFEHFLGILIRRKSTTLVVVVVVFVFAGISAVRASMSVLMAVSSSYQIRTEQKIRQIK